MALFVRDISSIDISDADLQSYKKMPLNQYYKYTVFVVWTIIWRLNVKLLQSKNTFKNLNGRWDNRDSFLKKCAIN